MRHTTRPVSCPWCVLVGGGGGLLGGNAVLVLAWGRGYPYPGSGQGDGGTLVLGLDWGTLSPTPGKGPGTSELAYPWTRA